MLSEKFYVIDAHCHVYPAKIATAAVSATDAFYGVVSALDGSTDALRKEMQVSGVDHALVQSVATTPHQVGSINRFIAQTVRDNPCFTGLGTLHPDSADQAADVEEILALGLKGVKLHPDIQGFAVDDARCMKIYELCQEAGLVILMHTGDSRYDNSNPNRLLPVLKAFPRLTVIGGHLGGYSVWDEASRAYGGLPNFYVDTSSSIFFLGVDRAKEIILRYGFDHVLFGTDYPMYRAQSELAHLLEMGFTEAEYEKIFSKNARRLFKL
ncbi:MAG: amidohydrolase [Oscillospiraceae bacterium]|nr:amidohydrolase [Oscillospiraceae bacterium]